MAMTDPLGDMLTRIRNGQRARRTASFRRRRSCAPACSMCCSAKAISAAIREEQLGPAAGLRIELKYFEGQPAIQHVARVSKPGRRVYSGAQGAAARSATALASPSSRRPRGVLSDAEARDQNVGGEVLAEVF